MRRWDRIDKGIRPLVDAMNATGWIETVSSCQGHPRDAANETPYVAFYGKASRVPELCEILNRADRAAPEGSAWLNLSIVHGDDINGCQRDARRGWIALDLHIEILKPRTRAQVIAALTETFRSAAPTVGPTARGEG